MVLYTLYIKADLENVSSLALRDDADLCLSVRNPVDHEEIRERIIVDSSALEPTMDELHKKGHTQHDHHHSLKQQHHPHQSHHAKQHYREPPCHFALKWASSDNNNNKSNKQRATIRVIKDSKRQYLAQDSGTFVPVLQLDCDGLEPYAFYPLGNNEFIVTNQAGVEIENVDLSSSSSNNSNNKYEWSDYDLGTGTTSITNFEAKFE